MKWRDIDPYKINLDPVHRIRRVDVMDFIETALIKHATEIVENMEVKGINNNDHQIRHKEFAVLILDGMLERRNKGKELSFIHRGRMNILHIHIPQDNEYRVLRRMRKLKEDDD